jgi:predicted transposase
LLKLLPLQSSASAKLIPSQKQAKALKATLEAFAHASNQALKIAQENNADRIRISTVHLHRLYYAGHAFRKSQQVMARLN